MLEIEGLEQHVLDIRDNLLTVLADDLQYPVKGPLFKGFKMEGTQDFIAIYPVLS
jgi:hypothetical protein